MPRFHFALRFPEGSPSYNLSVTFGAASPGRRGLGNPQTLLLRLQPLRQILPRCDVDGRVHLVQHHAGLGTAGFPDVLHLGGVHRDLGTGAGLEGAGIQHGKLGGFLSGGVGDILAPAHDHHVAAGGLLHMEPQVLAPGGVQGELGRSGRCSAPPGSQSRRWK